VRGWRGKEGQISARGRAKTPTAHAGTCFAGWNGHGQEGVLGRSAHPGSCLQRASRLRLATVGVEVHETWRVELEPALDEGGWVVRV
jgi:hypothetical protein